jgi:hypothetical protein
MVGELASHLFWLPTEDEINILRENVKKIKNNAMNVTLFVHKIHTSMANYQSDEIEAISNKISKT